MNALDLLKSNHQRVRDLFVALRDSSSLGEKREIYEAIREEIERHSDMEESGFYPALGETGKDLADIIEDSIEDHQEMRDVFADIEESGDEEDLIDLMDELIELMERHIQDQEQIFFVELKERLEKAELEQIGERLIQMKRSKSRAA